MSADPRGESLEICMAQKANMEAIFHSVADGIVTIAPDLEVLNLNRAAETMLDVPAAMAAGRPIGDVLVGSLWSLEPLLRQCIESGEPARERENLLVRPDAREVRVLITASRLLSRTGEVAGAVVVMRDITRIRELEARLDRRSSLHSLAGTSHGMQEIFSLIEQVAPTDSTILIHGESGTGKELIADAIHRCSRRSEGPFVKVNCSALSESLLESELFGHVKGAFTGALHSRKGRFELANGGTIFLDEIGDLSEGIQVKLLRVLQEREIERVGDSQVLKIDVRIVAATHQPLRQRVAEGRFRQDLYYRLNVIPIEVPPLRDRLEDLPALATTFLEEMNERLGKEIEGFSSDAMRALMDHRWPGNVRELRNAIEHAAVKCRGDRLLLEDLPREIIEATSAPTASRTPAPASIATPSTPEVPVESDDHPSTPGDMTERDAILQALRRTGWNRGETAQLLGVNRTTLWRRMQRLGIKTDAA